jgi:hypothetical protein
MRRRVRNDRSNKFIDGFLQTILNAGLFDANGALANEAWFQMFPRANVEKLVVPALNHYPILLDRDLVRFGGHIASLSLKMHGVLSLSLMMLYTGAGIIIRICLFSRDLKIKEKRTNNAGKICYQASTKCFGIYAAMMISLRSVVLGSIEVNSMLPSICQILPSYIPKGEEQKTMKDWRLISLCNFIYKL